MRRYVSLGSISQLLLKPYLVARLIKGWELVDSCVLTPRPVPYISEEALLQLRDPVACFCYRKPRQ